MTLILLDFSFKLKGILSFHILRTSYLDYTRLGCLVKTYFNFLSFVILRPLASRTKKNLLSSNCFLLLLISKLNKIKTSKQEKEVNEAY